MTIDDVRKKITTLVVKKEMLHTRKEECKNTLTALEKEVQAVLEAQVFLQLKAQQTQEKIKLRLEDIVNLALHAVFGDMYKFQLSFVLRRNKTECDIQLIENNVVMDDILDSTGGGAGDIVSFFLRVALLVISGKRRLLILDEPFKGVDAERKPIALQVLKELTEDLGIQVICVTHDQKIVAIADQVIKVRKDDGKSFVEVV